MRESDSVPVARGQSEEAGERDNGGRVDIENHEKRICRKVNNENYKDNRRVRKKR